MKYATWGAFLLGVHVAAGSVLAQFTVFHDRAAWRTASGGPGSITEGFGGRGVALTPIVADPMPLAGGAMTIRRNFAPGPGLSGIAQIINFGPVSTFGGEYAQFDLIALASPSIEEARLDLAFTSPVRSFGFDASYNRDPIRSLVERRFFAGDSLLGAFQLPQGTAFSGVTLGVGATRAEVWAVRPSQFDSTHAPFNMDNIEASPVPAPGAVGAVLAGVLWRRARRQASASLDQA